MIRDTRVLTTAAALVCALAMGSQVHAEAAPTPPKSVCGGTGAAFSSGVFDGTVKVRSGRNTISKNVRVTFGKGGERARVVTNYVSPDKERVQSFTEDSVRVVRETRNGVTTAAAGLPDGFVVTQFTCGSSGSVASMKATGTGSGTLTRVQVKGGRKITE
jgi:hypothetical protein